MPRKGAKGGTRTPGSGRKKGTQNKVIVEVRLVAQQIARRILEDPVVQALWLQEARNGTMPLAREQMLAKYAWGVPVERQETTGAGGGPLEIVFRRRDAPLEISERSTRHATALTAL